MSFHLQYIPVYTGLIKVHSFSQVVNRQILSANDVPGSALGACEQDWGF